MVCTANNVATAARRKVSAGRAPGMPPPRGGLEHVGVGIARSSYRSNARARLSAMRSASGLAGHNRQAPAAISASLWIIGGGKHRGASPDGPGPLWRTSLPASFVSLFERLVRSAGAGPSPPATGAPAPVERPRGSRRGALLGLGANGDCRILGEP